jgi:hypothetical protein
VVDGALGTKIARNESSRLMPHACSRLLSMQSAMELTWFDETSICLANFSFDEKAIWEHRQTQA